MATCRDRFMKEAVTIKTIAWDPAVQGFKDLNVETVSYPLTLTPAQKSLLHRESAAFRYIVNKCLDDEIRSLLLPLEGKRPYVSGVNRGRAAVKQPGAPSYVKTMGQDLIKSAGAAALREITKAKSSGMPLDELQLAADLPDYVVRYAKVMPLTRDGFIHVDGYGVFPTPAGYIVSSVRKPLSYKLSAAGEGHILDVSFAVENALDEQFTLVAIPTDATAITLQAGVLPFAAGESTRTQWLELLRTPEGKDNISEELTFLLPSALHGAPTYINIYVDMSDELSVFVATCLMGVLRESKDHQGILKLDTDVAQVVCTTCGSAAAVSEDRKADHPSPCGCTTGGWLTNIARLLNQPTTPAALPPPCVTKGKFQPVAIVPHANE